MNTIPTQILTHENEKVFFAFRTMQENQVRTGGVPDVPHRHDFYTILLVVDAHGSHFIDFIEHKIEPNVVFFVAPGQVHQVVVTSEKPEGYILMFNDEFLSRNYISEEFIFNLGMFSCGEGTPPIALTHESANKLAAFSKEIETAFHSSSPFKFESISAHIKLFLIECNQFAVQSKDQNPQAMQSGRPLVRSFRELLDKNYAQWHKVAEYAEAMNISPDYLNNVLKSNIGKTAKDMIFQRIALEAKRFGIHTNLSTKEIAYQLGFDDPSHFSKFFKNETQQSFSDFRQQLEN